MPRASLQPLPVDEIVPELLGGLQRGNRLVLQAATGAGKTTRVPPALTGTVERRVVVLEPRRVAARAAAARVAEERGWSLGDEVGFQIRFERRWGDTTRLIYVTEGVLLRWLQDDPFLDGVGAVVLDEFHERSLAADTALALLRSLQGEVRDDLRLVVMSATLEAERIAQALDAPALVSEGRTFPVEIEYLRRPDERGVPEKVAAAVLREAKGSVDGEGSILAFLPGVGEIRRTAKLLERADCPLPVHELYGDLPLERQAGVLRGRERRVVLATNVAETSVTVEGATTVVDSGLHRQLRLDPSAGLDRLELLPISRASADQRAGRAGRQSPGRAVRLWTESEQASRLPADRPEIERVDFSATALTLHSLGEQPADLPWLDPPKPAALARAEKLLEELDALSPVGLTELGQRMAALPLHPRQARLLLETHELGLTRAGATLAALLAERDVVDVPRGPHGSHGSHGRASLPPTDSDLLDRLEALLDSRSALAGRLERSRARHVRRVAEQLEGMVRGDGSGSREPADGAAPPRESLARCLLAAYPDRLALLSAPELEAGASEAPVTSGRMVGGVGVRLSPRTAVALEPGTSALALCLDLGGLYQRGDRRVTSVHSATLVERAWLDERHVVERERAFFEPGAEKVVGERVLLYSSVPITADGDPQDDRSLVLESSPAPVDPEIATRALIEAALEDPPRALGLDREPLAGLLRRLRFVHRHVPEADLPVLTDDTLTELIEGLAAGRTGFDELRGAARSWIPNLLDHRQRTELDRLAPERLRLPCGHTARIDYPDEGSPDDRPVLAAKIQDLFGWQDTPRIADGRVPLLLHLLAPNQRPQQITDDLHGFWTGTYELVRKELAGRYPKHPWPEDPLHAEPARKKGRRR